MDIFASIAPGARPPANLPPEKIEKMKQQQKGGNNDDGRQQRLTLTPGMGPPKLKVDQITGA